MAKDFSRNNTRTTLMNSKSYINDAFYFKVYIIDFIVNDKIKDTFAFSVPPQSEEIRYSQRIGETKTFGGVVYEDYGNDTVKITLSGTTINRDVKRIYTHDGSIQTYEEYDEIFALRDIINKWGKLENLKDKSVRLSDLSTGNTWNVVINEFTMKRSKESPFNYTYNISFSGIQETFSKRRKSKKNIHNKHFDYRDDYTKQLEFSIYAESLETYVEKLEETDIDNSVKKISIADMQKSLNKTLYKTRAMGEKFKKTLASAADSLNLVKKFEEITQLINTCSEIVQEYIKIEEGLLDFISPTHIIDVLDSSQTMIESAYRLVLDNPARLFNSILKYAGETKYTIDTIKEYMSNGTIWNINNIDPTILSQYEDSLQNFYDEWNIVLEEYEESVDEMVATGKGFVETTYGIIPGTVGESDSIVPIYGYTEKTVKDADTWESIGNEIYGSPDYGPLLALYNNETELKSGETIYLPILDQIESTSENNLVYNDCDVKDNYGVDIAIVDGDFNFENSDFSVQTGAKNLQQAIDNRLTSELDSRIRLSLYGIKSSVGNRNAALTFLKLSIKETVMADPRIRSIDKLKVYGKGDTVIVTFEYTDINNNKNSYGGKY